MKSWAWVCIRLGDNKHSIAMAKPKRKDTTAKVATDLEFKRIIIFIL
jgi:hypothetical protein